MTSNILQFNRLRVEIRDAEKLLATIIAVHERNLSNGSADPDEFRELYDMAIESLVNLSLLEKKTMCSKEGEE